MQKEWMKNSQLSTLNFPIVLLGVIKDKTFRKILISVVCSYHFLLCRKHSLDPGQENTFR